MADMIKQTEIRPLKCLVVDDEPVAVKGIVAYIEKLDFLETASTCSSALEAAEVLKKEEIDLMFLDINMPYLSGLEFLESLDKAPMTILTTAYSEYALEGYRLNVVDYLLKPISFQRFFQAAMKAREIFKSQVLLKKNKEDASTDDMYVRQGDSFKRIAWEDILYVEGMQNYLKLYFKDETLVIHQTMSSLEEILPKDAFFRIHRSFLVNISRIDTITGGRIFIHGKELPVSRPKKEELLKTVVYKNLISK
ncbi:MAG: LytTR family DNA-binding domain-containing protein [Odoribacteraceae bacterium]|jgi:DNA-binding LytR/AlgR family response regulator|nr:LytTR family DNA-binding domain-containing protein [Odoribacteraceae bacterium]